MTNFEGPQEPMSTADCMAGFQQMENPSNARQMTSVSILLGPCKH